MNATQQRHSIRPAHLQSLQELRQQFDSVSRSSRNQPSNTHFIFGPSSWLRGLITPSEGWALVYIDWIQQEFGIAAALSGDPTMQAAYQTGDAYLAFAKQTRAVPAEATKKTHGVVRDQFKQCVLGTQYGMEYLSLSRRINQPTIVARLLLETHRELYHQYWKWSDNTVCHAMLHNWQATVFGWVHHLPESLNPRSVRNFHMQANGAEMLRPACCLGTENGIQVCAPNNRSRSLPIHATKPQWRQAERRRRPVRHRRED